MAEIGVSNLLQKAQEGLRLQEFKSGIYGLFLDGNFEASLILLDILWDKTLRSYIKNNYVLAIPSRDVLAFCDIDSQEGIGELRAMCSRVSEDGDHLLTNTLYYRTKNGWAKFNAKE